jgi:hypothetical protein
MPADQSISSPLELVVIRGGQAALLVNTDITRVPFDVAAHAHLKLALKKWIAKKTGTFGRQSFGYNYKTFKRNTTATLGGTRTGGGGADDEFKRVLRLMAEFL